MNFNKVILYGNVVNTPVVFERGGRYLVSFILATSVKEKNAYGESVKESDYHDIIHSTVSRDYADGIKKGASVLLSGTVKSKKSEDGKHKVKIKAFNLQYE